MTPVTYVRRRHRLVLATMLAAVPAAGCASPVLDRTDNPAPVVVGAPAGPDGVLLAELYAGALRATGVAVEIRGGGDDSTDPLDALGAGEVTLVPGYSGRLLAHYAPGATETDAEDVFDALARSLPADAVLADPASAQNRAVLTAAEDGAEVAGIATRCARLTLVYTQDFAVSGGLTALDRIGCAPGESRRADVAGAARAATDPDTLVGTTTVALAAGHDGAAGERHILHDAPDRVPRERRDTDATTAAPVFPAQNVVPVVRKDALGEAQLEALQVIAGELTTADLAELVDRIEAGEDPAAVADRWLAERG